MVKGKGKGLKEKHDVNIDRRNEVRGRHLQNTNVDLSSSEGSQLGVRLQNPRGVHLSILSPWE